MSSVVRRSGRKRKSSIYNSSEYASLDEDEANHPIGAGPVGYKKNKVSNTLFIESRPSCQKLLTKLMMHEFGWPFNQPVDPVALGLPDYFQKISHPMDFGTIQKKLDADIYKSSDEFANDVRLVFNNCWTYNAPGSDIYVMATTLSTLFEKQFKQVKAKEAKLVDDTEIEEMKSLVDELRAEHTKLLTELQKLVKESSSPPPLAPLNLNNGPYAQIPAASPSLASSIPEHPKKSVPKKKVQRKPRTPKAPKKKVFDLKEKELLSDKINKLSQDNLQKMVEMIAKDIPEDKKKNGELEIDLETLSDSTLQKLDKFVDTCLKNQEEQLQNRTIPAGEEHTMMANPGPSTTKEATNGNGNDMKKSGEESSSSSSDSESDSSSSSSDSESESEASDKETKPTNNINAQQPTAQV